MNSTMPVDSFPLLKMLMALGFILGCLFLLTWLFKRYTAARPSGVGGNRFAMRIRSTLPLGERRFLAVVELLGKHYFIGVTPQSVQLLNELDIPIDTGSTPEPPPERVLERAMQLLHKVKK